MKKRFLLIIPLCLVLVGCSLFKKSDEEIKKIYIDVLNSDVAFYSDGVEEFVFTITDEEQYSLRTYAFTDINEDDSIDMIAYFSRTSRDKYYVIFTMQGNKVYGFRIEDENFDGFSKNGYSFYTESDGTNGWRKYYIEDDELTYDYKFKINSDETKCEMDGKTIDCEEYHLKRQYWETEENDQLEWIEYKK